MADWKYPTGAYKAYVPGGRFGRGIGRGLQQLGEGLGQWGAQMLAIKQYEAEKEERRQQRLRERAQQQADIQRQEFLQHQADLKASYAQAEERQYEEEQATKAHERDIEKIKLQQQGRMNLAQTRQQRASSELDQVESDLAITTASAVKDAIAKGDVGRLRVLRNNIRFNGQKGRFLQQKATQVRDAEGNLTNTYKVVGANDYRILLKAVDDAIGGSGQGDMYEDIRQRLLKAMEGDDKAIDDEIAKMLDEGINQVLISNIIFQLERE